MALYESASGEILSQIALRLPAEWRNALKASAARNGRSLNSEVLQRLKPTVEPEIEAETSTQK